MSEIESKIREHYYREPFVPVEIVLKSGRRLLVEYASQIAFPPAFRGVHVIIDDGDHDYHAFGDIESVREAKKRRPGARRGRNRRAA